MGCRLPSPASPGTRQAGRALADLDRLAQGVPQLAAQHRPIDRSGPGPRASAPAALCAYQICVRSASTSRHAPPQRGSRAEQPPLPPSGVRGSRIAVRSIIITAPASTGGRMRVIDRRIVFGTSSPRRGHQPATSQQTAAGLIDGLNAARSVLTAGGLRTSRTSASVTTPNVPSAPVKSPTRSSPARRAPSSGAPAGRPQAQPRALSRSWSSRHT